MKALITGASSGIGRDMARYLASKNIDLILVARRKENLEKLANEFNVNVTIIAMDLGNEKNVYKLYDKCKNENIDILINNAGFGLFGEFDKTDIDVEANMVDTNVKAPLILMKAFLQRFKKQNHGRILNVASAAAFTYGPLMSVYYATKSFLYAHTLSVYGELKKEKSPIYVGVLCPGPVKTEFQERANVNFTIKAQTSEQVASYAVKKMFKNKLIIVPSFILRVGKFFTRFLSEKMLIRIGYHFQKNKK